MSSSRSGQWMPRPLPISRQRFRSSVVPCESRGYHATGAEIARPSVSSTQSVSSLTRTCAAAGTCVSAVEEFIPAFQQVLLILYDKSLDLVDPVCSKAMAPLQPDRIEPEFRLAVVSFDMHVRRLVSVASVEEETIGATSEYGWHCFILPSQTGPGNGGSDGVRLLSGFLEVIIALF